MTPGARALLAAAAAAAAVDWVAVWTDRRRIEQVAKPAVLVLLVGAAVALEPASEAQRWWFVAALVASLVGDVLLMPPHDAFIQGLAAFLLAHIAYSVGFATGELSAVGAGAGFVVPVLGLAVVGRRMLVSVLARGDRILAIAVCAYLVVISTMVVLAWAGGRPLAALGATLFFVSDALIGWTRFVGDLPHGRVAVMVTYHLGQGALVWSLVG